MRELNTQETKMVSGSGVSSDFGNALNSANSTNTAAGDVTGSFDDFLKAISEAFNKISSILNYYTNLFPLPGSSKK
ncbi:hypothetical protein SOASR032_04930 [Pragia fontium]|uniref:Uncharacterized protein n=1 Tax=Pragia fontium TaxID=82985 RepID=A0ABQ5LF44_9GAMM|nr:hypothetical protein [Pragia fontium]AKJ42044.1 hypothetical protein QQ39_08060 [Pragia fontium]GKX61924.1 hypothetical protein SOASR032_04930 [Pragia fontium]